MYKAQEYPEIYNYSFSLYEEVLNNGFLLLKKDKFTEKEALVFKSIINLSSILLRSAEKSLVSSKIKFNHLINENLNLEWYPALNKDLCKKISIFCDQGSPKKKLNRDVLGQYIDFNENNKDVELMDKFDLGYLLYKLIISLDTLNTFYLSEFNEIKPTKNKSLYLRKKQRNKSIFEPLISDIAQLQNAFFETKERQVFPVSKIKFFRRIYCHWIGEKIIKDIRGELNLFEISFESKILKA